VAWVLATALAGGLGAALRYVVGQSVAAWSDNRRHWATVGVNVLGSFLLGLAIGYNHFLAISAPAGGLRWWYSIVGTGFLGGFTTFSAAMVETLQLWQCERRATAVRYLLGTAAAAIIAAAAGMAISMELLSR